MDLSILTMKLDDSYLEILFIDDIDRGLNNRSVIVKGPVHLYKKIPVVRSSFPRKY